MSKVYTRTGDAGKTSLKGGERVAKNHPRVCAYGDIDELCARIGLLQSHTAMHSYADEINGRLRQINSKLFSIGSYLADPHSSTAYPGVTEADVTSLEHDMDSMQALLQPLHSFIIPGGTIAASHTHIGRTVCRRAERSILTLADTGAKIDPVVLAYINRLSDFLFVLARHLNRMAGVEDVPWIPGN